jgi:hypothetical protein
MACGDNASVTPRDAGPSTIADIVVPIEAAK